MVCETVQKGRHPASRRRSGRDLLPLIWVGDTGSWSGMTEWKIFQQYRALLDSLKSSTSWLITIQSIVIEKTDIPC